MSAPSNAHVLLVESDFFSSFTSRRIFECFSGVNRAARQRDLTAMAPERFGANGQDQVSLGPDQGRAGAARLRRERARGQNLAATPSPASGAMSACAEGPGSEHERRFQLSDECENRESKPGRTHSDVTRCNKTPQRS